MPKVRQEVHVGCGDDNTNKMAALGSNERTRWTQLPARTDMLMHTLFAMQGVGLVDLWKPALLIKQVQHSKLLFNEVKYILVVHKLNVAPVNGFSLILSL